MSKLKEIALVGTAMAILSTIYTTIFVSANGFSLTTIISIIGVGLIMAIVISSLTYGAARWLLNKFKFLKW